MESMVEVRNVSKRFGDFAAVERVDLNLRAGEFLTLLGPSGCGKTTLLRMISGFETPSEGAVFLAGQNVTHLPPYRRDVNQVFQSYALFPHLSVWSNIAFGLKMKKVPAASIRQRVERAIDLVSLAGLQGRKPSQLSGGQKQRVALARALVCEPKVLLLDEPLAALDAKLRRAMQIELKRLQSRLGITFLFVTHDQEEALAMSDRIAVVNKGRIEQIGAAEEIYHRPATPFVADFLGQANVLEARVESRDGQMQHLALKGDAKLAVSAEAVDSKPSLLISIRPERVAISSEPMQGANRFEATVREEIFRGASHQILIQLPGGLELTALVSSRGADQRFGAGSRVWCSIDPADVVVLR